MWAHATDCNDSSEKQHTRQSLIPERERERERERSIQNQGVKWMFEQKCQLVNGVQRRRHEEELLDTTDQVWRSFINISNETGTQMSKAVNSIQEEHAALMSKYEDREHQIAELHKNK